MFGSNNPVIRAKNSIAWQAIACCTGLAILLGGCGAAISPTPPSGRDARSESTPKLFGDIELGGKGEGFDKNLQHFKNNLSRKDKPASESQKTASGAGFAGTILWRATLDTISFLPLASADSSSGIIITDWYSLPDYPNERVKLNAYIKSYELRSDAIKISYFKQSREKNGQWSDSPVDMRTASDLENTILSRARQIRLDSQAAQSQNP
ncbi:MAG: DUF3576 domain-containing protein [Alphaproteobacteria bacterium]|nr:DUF3576 domain-containing protein [Alphaproteobacteria bacterium]